MKKINCYKYTYNIFLQDCGGPGPDFDCEANGGDGFYEYAKNCIKKTLSKTHLWKLCHISDNKLLCI